MKNVNLIVFDLDGTLADTAPEIQSCLNAALAQWNLSAYTIEEVKGFIGNGAKVLAERALRGRAAELAAQGQLHGASSSEVSAEMHTAFFGDLMGYYNQSENSHTQLYSGVIDFLRNASVPLALLTNKPTYPTTLFLQHFGLATTFLRVVTGESAPRPKPFPEGLMQIIHELNTTPERTLMVGDGKPDIEVAKAVGAKSCALLQGFALESELRALNPDWVVPSFAAFVSLCSDILK